MQVYTYSRKEMRCLAKSEGVHVSTNSFVVCVWQAVGEPWNIRYLPLAPRDPVPSDIEVARGQTPKNIAELASEIGLRLTEVRRYPPVQRLCSLESIETSGHQKCPYSEVIITDVLVLGRTKCPL